MLGWAWCGSHKKSVRTHYAELVFLPLVQFVGHIVCSNVFVVRNNDAQFFIPRWARFGSHEKCVRTHCTELVFLHPGRYVGHIVCSGACQA
jgi:hypothetical protein